MLLFIIGIIVIIVGIILFIVAKSEKEDDDFNYKPPKYVGIVGVIIGVIATALSLFTSIPTGHTGIPVTFGKVSVK